MRPPELPRETCPKIDAIILSCKEAREDIAKMARELDVLDDKFASIIDDIEELRKANSALREYGIYYKELWDLTT